MKEMVEYYIKTYGMTEEEATTWLERMGYIYCPWVNDYE